MMNTPYDVLGVSRNASNETIKAAFYKTAKACHPDLHAGDRTAEQQLRQAITAYHILKSPQQRAAYNLDLKQRRRARIRRFAAAVVAGLVSGTSVAFAVWLSVPLLHTQVVIGSPAPLAPLAREWEQVKTSGDPKAIWAFTVRNADAPEAALARSRLVELIDTTEDVSLLQVLRLVATGVIAERAQERLVRLGALAVVKVGSAISDTPPSHVWQPSGGEAIELLAREEPALPTAELVTTEVLRAEAPAVQAAEDRTIKLVKREQRALQAAEVATSKVAAREEPALQAPVYATEVRRTTSTARAIRRHPAAPKHQAKSQAPVRQASSENASACPGPCAGPLSPLFGVGF